MKKMTCSVLLLMLIFIPLFAEEEESMSLIDSVLAEAGASLVNEITSLLSDGTDLVVEYAPEAIADLVIMKGIGLKGWYQALLCVTSILLLVSFIGVLLWIFYNEEVGIPLTLAPWVLLIFALPLLVDAKISLNKYEAAPVTYVIKDLID